MTNENSVTIARSTIAVQMAWLAMLLMFGMLEGCSASDAIGNDFGTLLRLKDGLQARYGEHLNMHEVNVILKTTLETKTVQEIDLAVDRGDAGEWQRIPWERVRRQIVESLRGEEAVVDDRSAASMECALRSIEPPIETWTETSSFPFSAKGQRMAWEKAVLLFKDKMLVDIIPIASSE